MWSLIEHSASLAEAVIITGFTTMVLGYKSPGHKYLKIYSLYACFFHKYCFFSKLFAGKSFGNASGYITTYYKYDICSTFFERKSIFQILYNIYK